jgi:signal transduction histidine kinase
MTGLLWLRDARLTPLALSALPAWLWSPAAMRVLWANATGAAILGAPTPAALAVRPIEPTHPAVADVTRLMETLRRDGTPRLERLRGFGTVMGRPITCSCLRIMLDDGAPAVLIAAVERAGPELPLRERASRLIAACVEPVALFDDDGGLIAATTPARRLMGNSTSLARLGARALVVAAGERGHAAGTCDIGAIAINRVRDPAAWIVAFGDELAQRPATTEVAPASGQAATKPPAAELPVPAPRDQSPEDVRAQPFAVQPELFPELAPASPAAALPTEERRHPLRFVWQMGPDGRFTIDCPEFIALAGPRTAALMGQPWPFIASVMMLDPEGEVARAIATRATWSGVTVSWRVDDSEERLAVELAGLPVFDRERTYRGYRGFGVCRDLACLNAIAQMRRTGATMAPADERSPDSTESGCAPALTSVEQYAFFELSRQLTSRINEAEAQARRAANTNEPPWSRAPSIDEPPEAEPAIADQIQPFLDRLPIGVLIYRLSHLLYANKAFLDWAGRDSLKALAEAGGLDSLLIEPDAIAIEEGGRKPFTITSLKDEDAVAEARLLQVPWQGESAFALLTMPPHEDAASKAALAEARARASELDAILDSREEDLLAARRDAERAAAAKSDFLAKISHEIRTPLNAIIGFAEVMMEERFGPVGNERYRQYLKDIHTSGAHLIALINDLLDLSKIEAGKIELTFASVSLNDLIQQCVAIMQAQANRERVIIRTALSPRLPRVMADARSVRQIVLNLLSNAIKFTAAGGQVIVSTAINDTGEVVLRVRDTGIGMSEAELATALEPFRQSATTTGARSGGSGLGLPLTKALAQANHATFQIKSAPNEGTLVEITFPGARLLAAQ